MKRPVQRALAPLTLLVLLAPGAAGHRYFDDAGTGSDASDVPASPTPVAYGSHAGYLLPRDADWYEVADARATPACVEASFLAQPIGRATLAVHGALGVRTASLPFNGSGGTLAVASPDLRASDLGFQNTLPDFRNQGNYSFSIAATGVEGIMGDAGTGLDSSADDPFAVGRGCFAGVVDPFLGLGDEEDAYVVQVPATSLVTLSFAHAAGEAPVDLAVAAPDGTPLATLRSGDVVTFTAPTNGGYTLSAATASGALAIDGQAVEYLVGVVFGPPGAPCRPTCAVNG